jgi:hypothetical protein
MWAAEAGYDALQFGSVQEEGMPASPQGPVLGIVGGNDAHATVGEECAAGVYLQECTCAALPNAHAQTAQ